MQCTQCVLLCYGNPFSCNAPGQLCLTPDNFTNHGMNLVLYVHYDLIFTSSGSPLTLPPHPPPQHTHSLSLPLGQTKQTIEIK